MNKTSKPRRTGILLHTIRFCTVWFCLADPALAVADNGADAQQAIALAALKSGAAYVIKMNNDEGTLQAGQEYVIQYHPGTKVMTTSAVHYKKIASYPTPSFTSDGILSAWGHPFRIARSGSRLCLARILKPSEISASTCEAELFPLHDRLLRVNPDLPNPTSVVDLAQYGANRAVVNLNAAMHKTVDMCMTDIIDPVTGKRIHTKKLDENGDPIPQTQYIYRETGDTLYYQASVLPFVADEEAYHALDDKINEAIDYLMINFPPTIGAYSDYSNCYPGSQDANTPFQVMRGMYEYYKIYPRRDIRAYIIETWKTLEAQGDIAQIGGGNAGSMNVENNYSMYLKEAVMMEELNTDDYLTEPALKPYTQNGIHGLFTTQTNVPDTVCYNNTSRGRSPTPTPQGYGGWPHAALTPGCEQHLGYHAMITNTLLDLHAYLSELGYCNGSDEWAYTCANMPWNVLAGLAWINNLQVPADYVFPEDYTGDRVAAVAHGSLFDRYVPAEPGTSRPGSGNATGADSSFRIFAAYPNLLQGDVAIESSRSGSGVTYTMKSGADIKNDAVHTLQLSVNRSDLSAVTSYLRWVVADQEYLLSQGRPDAQPANTLLPYNYHE